MTTKTEAQHQIGQEFMMTREFDVPREIVWKACTEAKQVAQWWGPHGFTAPICEWDARPGNKIYVVMRGPDGTDYPMSGKFHEVVPPERLVTMTGALDEKGEMIFEFRHTLTLEERNGKTKLTMHSRLISATAGAEKYVGGFETGMTQTLERLGELLATKSEALIIERTFNATAAKVWNAITDVDEMRQWYFELNEFKPEVGFEFEFAVEHGGNSYHHLCKVTEVLRQKKIAYTWRYQGQPGNSLVTFELFGEGNKTRVKLSHTGIETFPRTPAYSRKNFETGWTTLIGDELKKFVESTEKK
ncbi:MAG TPA: SRPBCC family protein [Chthoniobacterales bacterium]|jgi:uncharacterized protein YndB with AHSA1/START domain|nr:SRPBCC family protein [Chthoniobacterales bacterium]